MSRLTPLPADDQAFRLHEIERRIAELEARPRTGIIARMADIVTGTVPFTATGNTDMSVSNVACVDYRVYKIYARRPFQINPGPGRWLIYADTGGAHINRLDDLDSGVVNAVMEGHCLWYPTSGLYTITVNAQEVTGTSTLNFVADATATGQLWVEDAGPR